MAVVRDLYLLLSDTDITRIENDSNGAAIYIGKAAPGTGEDETGWQIRKLTYVSGAVTEISFADGSPAYSKIWDDRATYTYQ